MCGGGTLPDYAVRGSPCCRHAAAAGRRTQVLTFGALASRCGAYKHVEIAAIVQNRQGFCV